MNHEKAREYFSAYYEDTLEAGLRNSMDQRLQTDAQLQAEYRAFRDTMEGLSLLNLEEIEVPSYLSDRIANRLEQAKGPVNRTSWLTLWLPRLALGGLATAALFGAMISVYGSGNSKNFEGNALESLFHVGQPKPAPTSDRLLLSPRPATSSDAIGVDAVLSASAPKTVVFSDEAGKILNTVDLKKGQTLRSPISNNSSEPSLTQIHITEEATATWVALPGGAQAGSTKVERKPGSGTVKEFVMALSAAYRQPVILRANSADTMISWNFKVEDQKTAAIESLKDSGYTVTVSASNLLTIGDR